MALIKCEECEKQVSDKAQSCPNCGAPIVVSKSSPLLYPQEPSKSKAKISPSAWFALILLVIGAFWLFQTPSFKEQNLTPLPVDVGYRSALIGDGLVLKVKNNSNRTLTILATLSNPTLHSEKTFNLTTAPNDVAEIGHLEGWVLVSGDQIKLSNSDYKSWQGSVP